MRSILILLTVAALGVAGQETKTPPPAAKAAAKAAVQAQMKGSAATKAPAKADAKGATKAPAKQVAKAATSIDPNSVPPGAKEIEPGLYRVVDASGKPWLYTRTPFGFMKSPEAKEFVQPEAVPTDWTVVDGGDSVTFTRPYPFGGTKTWTVKKAQMNEVEEAVWKKSQGLEKK